MAHRHRPTWAASPGQSRRFRPPGDRGGPGARRARHPHPGRRGDHAGRRRAAVEPGQDRALSRTGAQPIPLRVRHQPTRSGVGPDGRGAAGPGEGRRRTPPGTQVGAGEHRGGDPRGRSGRGGGVLGWRWQRSGAPTRPQPQRPPRAPRRRGPPTPPAERRPRWTWPIYFAVSSCAGRVSSTGPRRDGRLRCWDICRTIRRSISCAPRPATRLQGRDVRGRARSPRECGTGSVPNGMATIWGSCRTRG
jgi:hypothetical protein